MDRDALSISAMRHKKERPSSFSGALSKARLKPAADEITLNYSAHQERHRANHLLGGAAWGLLSGGEAAIRTGGDLCFRAGLCAREPLL